MDHKLGVKANANIQHGGTGEKTSLAKKSESGLKNAARKVGNVVSISTMAADKAIGNIDNKAVQIAHKSLHIASDAARLGGKTVKVAAKTTGKVIKTSFKLSRAVAQKVRLAKMKDKPKLKVKTSKLYKTMNAALATKKYFLKPAAKASKNGVKLGSSAAGTVTDKAAFALGSIDNDTARFAKKAYDVANTTGAIALKTGKGSAKIIRGTGKTVRTLLTKKGRRQLVKSVKRRVDKIKRNVQRTQKIAKTTAKATKATAKFAAKAAKLAAQLVSRFIGLLVSTAPFSIFLALFVAAVILITYLVSNSFTLALGKQERIAGWALTSSDEANAIYNNIRQLATILNTGCENKFAKPLKQDITNFANEASDPPNIIDYTIGDSEGTSYPASDSINSSIDDFINSASEYTSDNYSDFMAALVVLKSRGQGENFALEKFKPAEIEEFIGGVDSNSCTYGSTFFIKTTDTSTGETCPNEDCKTKTEPGCKCSSYTDEDGKVHEYCGGHPYCDHDHKKLTVTVQTVDEYYGNSIPEIYGFNEDETEYFNDLSSFISDLLQEMMSEGETDDQSN